METDLFMLLDTNSRNILSILSIISEKNEWYTIHEISEKLNVVERTIQRYIIHLKDCIDQFNEGEEENDRLFLSYEKYKGVHLETPKGHGLHRFKQLVLEQDETFIMLRDIFFEEFQSVTKYAMEHYISESKVRKSVKKIRYYLKRYHLSLSNISFKIVGEEKQIRLLTYYVVWYGLKGHDWPFRQVSQNKVYEVIDSLDESLSMKLTRTQRKQLGYMLAINLFRMGKNHPIELEAHWQNYVDINRVMDEMPFLSLVFIKRRQELTAEIYFYMLLIQLRINVYQSKPFIKQTLEYHKFNGSDVYETTNHFVEKFHTELHPIPSEFYHSFFLTTFCTHLFCRMFRYVILTDDGCNNIREWQNKYTVLISQLHQIIDKLYIQTNNVLFLQRPFLMQKYMMLFSMIKPLTHFEPTIKVLIESDLPYLKKTLLENDIIKRYSGDYHIEFINTSDVTIDIILTNVPNVLKNKEYSNSVIHFFEYPMMLRDIEELDKVIQKIYTKNYLVET